MVPYIGLKSVNKNLLDTAWLESGAISNKQPFGVGFLSWKQKISLPPEISFKRRTKRRRGNKGMRKK